MINIKKHLKTLLSLATILLPILHMECFGSNLDPVNTKTVGALGDKMEDSTQNKRFRYDTTMSTRSSSSGQLTDEYRTPDRKRRKTVELVETNNERSETIDLPFTQNGTVQKAGSDFNYETPPRSQIIVGAYLRGRESTAVSAKDLPLLPSYVRYEKY